MYLLGISAFYHDSAAALLKDGEILAAAQEERFTRRKHDPSFPREAVSYCLREAGISLDELSAVVFYEKPFLKFERLLETYYAYAPQGWRSFLSAMPVWMKQKLMLKRTITEELLTIGPFNKTRTRLLFPEHHLSHAAAAFFPSPFEEAAILTVDGVGEWATASIGHGRKNGITILCELRFPHSVGLLYSAFTYYLGFKVNSGEYKLMGLAPYGNAESERVRRYVELIREKMVEVKDDGSIWLNQEFFDYAAGLKMAKEEKWQALFEFPSRAPESELLPEHCDLAWAIQKVTEEIIIKMAGEAKRRTASPYLCLAGGVALNCVANGRLLETGLFDDIWVQPAAGDAGGALGAAYAAHYIHFQRNRVGNGMTDKMQGAFLGPQFTESDIKRVTQKYKAPYRHYEDFDLLCNDTAEALANGHVIGWFQGRMEWGPRALGNRSILADPRKSEMQKKLNLKVKFREGFRPFAPAVLAEQTGEYFNMARSSPYMLFISHVKTDRRRALPDHYGDRDWKGKLYYPRSDIPAITHIDYSVRLQTVHRETNPRYYKLIERFKERTGCGLIVNTSFNVRGEPIVCTPEDAYLCFMRTDMDSLVMDHFLFDKKEQPPLEERDEGKSKVVPD